MGGWVDEILYTMSGSDSYCTPLLCQALSWVLRIPQSPVIVPAFKEVQAGFLNL